MSDSNNRVYSVDRAGSLDNRIRRWFQNPQKILSPYIEQGTTVLDVGCGPGFFSIDMAHMVGKNGQVIACDIQEGMLQKVRDKINGTELEERVKLHKCKEDNIGITDHVDFALLFYMVHEVPNKDRFFKEIGAILKPNGRVLIVEPPFHVSNEEFEETVNHARNAGLLDTKGPKMLFHKTVILKKG